jgi:hypothetical protein
MGEEDTEYEERKDQSRRRGEELDWARARTYKR